MKKILDRTTDILANIATTSFIVIFAINMMEIVSRTFFDYSFLWVSDLSVICVVWMICLSMAVAVYRKEHLVMDFLVNRMARKPKKALAVIMDLVSMAFFAMLFYTGIQTAADKKALIFPSIQWSQVWAYSALPAFAILSLIFMIPRLISSIKGEKPDQDAAK